MVSIVFKYDISPITFVRNVQKQQFFELIVGICAILGGSYALSQAFYRLIGMA
jgi:uncharacterized membrane protein YuzA (DUF378 family)